MNTKEEEIKHNMRDESERMKKETPYVGPRREFTTQKEEVDAKSMSRGITLRKSGHKKFTATCGT